MDNAKTSLAQIETVAAQHVANVNVETRPRDDVFCYLARNCCVIGHRQRF